RRRRGTAPGGSAESRCCFCHRRCQSLGRSADHGGTVVAHSDQKVDAMQIISADERLREVRGAKVLLQGPTGIGKTWQARTLDPERTLFIDCEAGDLSILDWPAPADR